jgi:hypothetical protein
MEKSSAQDIGIYFLDSLNHKIEEIFTTNHIGCAASIDTNFWDKTPLLFVVVLAISKFEVRGFPFLNSSQTALFKGILE